VPAYLGTITTNSESLTLETVAAIPLKKTLSSVGMLLKPEPFTITPVLKGPVLGLMLVTAMFEDEGVFWFLMQAVKTKTTKKNMIELDEALRLRLHFIFDDI
jgi:hypothetical protein